MSSKRKGKAVWVARSDFLDSGYTCHRIKPKKQGMLYSSAGFLAHFGQSEFISFAGFELSPGECRKVRIVIEECK